MRPQLPRAALFPLAAVAWSLGLFGLLRSPWVEGRLVLPLTRWQQTAAEFYAGKPTAPIAVTTDCSGTDVLALCLAAIVAWPASWRARLAGAAGGIALILSLNTLRIGTLGRAASSPALFETLHLQVWPAVLVLATAGYVFGWMGVVGRTGNQHVPGATPDASFGRRFVFLAALFLIAFAFAGPWIARSETLLAAGAWTASLAAFLLATAGVGATASANILITTRGAFMVTPECLATALIPLYFAGVFAASLGWRLRVLAVAIALPFFASLAIARLLLLALPPALSASPLFLVHGFHQIVLGAILVASLAWWREAPRRDRRMRAAVRAILAMSGAGILAVFAGDALTSALLGVARAITPLAPHDLAALARPDDAQGALATLFVFQASLLLALGVTVVAGWQRLVTALAALFAIQVLFLVILVEASDRTGLLPHALLLRAWAVGLPMALALTMLRFQPPAENPLLQLAPDGPA